MGGGVVGSVVVPAAPDDVGPGAREDADGVGVVAAAGDGLAVEVGGPGLARRESPATSQDFEDVRDVLRSGRR